MDDADATRTNGVVSLSCTTIGRADEPGMQNVPFTDLHEMPRSGN
ncbi:MAG: hypothetical protein WCF44_03145 [Candidatus Methylophosphatis roskildensis]